MVMSIKIWNHIRRRQRRWRNANLTRSGWYDLSARSTMDSVFIGGCGRSGSTLFKEMLNRHTQCACGPETSLFGLPFDIHNIAPFWGIEPNTLKSMTNQSGNLIEFADRFAQDFIHSENKTRWVEKTPNNARAISRLLTCFPRGRFIHLVRDGRDVVCSLRHFPREIIRNGRTIPIHVTNPIERTSQDWKDHVAMCRAFHGHPRFLEVRYESLVQDPETELRRVCAFIDVSFEPGMLKCSTDPRHRPGQFLNNASAAQVVSKDSIGRWQRELSMRERRIFVNIAGELLIALGYVANHDWVSLPCFAPE